MTASNVVLATATSNSVEIYTTKIEETHSKKLLVLPFPQSSSNWGDGPKDVKLIDLLTKERRWTIDGFVVPASRTNMIALMDKGGTFTLDYNGEQFNVNLEKLSMTEKSEDKISVEPTEYDVKFTVIEGVDL